MRRQCAVSLFCLVSLCGFEGILAQFRGDYYIFLLVEQESGRNELRPYIGSRAGMKAFPKFEGNFP